MSVQDYSVGRRVYNGASNAPTRGTVDPSGYIDRELNKPSQSRSGLAAAALRRVNGGQAPAQAQTPPPPGGMQGSPMQGGPPVGMDPMQPLQGGPPAPLMMKPNGKICASASMFPTPAPGGMNADAY